MPKWMYRQLLMRGFRFIETLEESGSGNQPAEPPTEKPAEPPADKAAEGANEPDWKAEARKWEHLAKANDEAAKKLQEIEDAKKSELEKANDLIAKLTAENEAVKLNALRQEVAQEAGLPPKLAARLTGTDRETLLEDAKALAELVTPTQPTGDRKPWAGAKTAQGTTRTGKEAFTSLQDALAAHFKA